MYLLKNHKFIFQLHIAAYQNAFACYKTLLGSDCSINLKDIHNRTPLMLACYKGHMRIVGRHLKKKLFCILLKYLRIVVPIIYILF